MALTVRPDDEVYQFDTVWLGPDEYTLPIQARYVAWGTWLACFLLAAAVLVPVGGHGPEGVLGSLMWSVAISVVAARAVMLIVDHERPLRSLPKLFSAEARAALAAGRGNERSVVVQPSRVRVREVPDRVLRRRERDRLALQQRAERKAGHGRRTRPRRVAAARNRPEAQQPGSSTEPTPGWSSPYWSPAAALYQDWDDPDLTDQQWEPGPQPAQPYGLPPYGTVPSYGTAEYLDDANEYLDGAQAPPARSPDPYGAGIESQILLPARRVP
jgi:hypothetical protein